jgi:hypothetical protein
MTMWLQFSTMMSGRLPMYVMAVDIEGITRLLDEGVDPAADEEQWVRLMMSGRSGWTGEHVYLRCVSDALLTMCNSTALQLSI